MQNQPIPFNKLRLSPANARKTFTQAGIDALAVSIDAYGLLQPVIVSPATDKKSFFDVHAGGRRWRAIAQLIKSGKLPKNAMVDARVCNDEAAALAEEISLAENIIREAMSPADECRGYRAAMDKGESEEELARRMGVTVRHVQGRLRLADLAEPIFDALAEGKITLDVAKAYGSTSDRDTQLAAWNVFKDSWQGDQPHTIRRYVNDSAIEANSAVAKLVGEEEYLAAGGRIERDLFAGEGEGQWLDRPIAEDIARRKLEQAADAMAVGTLGWVRVLLAQHVPHSATEGLHDYYIRRGELSEEDQARMIAIEERLQSIEEELEDATDPDVISRLEAENEALDAEHTEIDKRSYVIPEDERPHVGKFVVLASDGTPKASHRYFSTKALKREKQSQKVTGGGADRAALEDALPRSLEEQLAKERRDVLALHIAHDPALALDLTIFRLARKFTGHAAYNDTGVMVTIGELFDPAGVPAAHSTAAQDGLDAVRSGLPCDWAGADDSFSAFMAFRELDETDKAAWLAFAVSQSLQASLASGDRANRFQSELGALLEIDTAEHWRPSADVFFDKIRKPQILSILGKLDPELPGRYASEKKAALSSAAAKLCAGEAIVTPEVKARAQSWIPDVMMFRAAGTPDEPEAPLVDDDSSEEQPAIDDADDEQADEANPAVNEVDQTEAILADAA
ncbi:putative plasmid stabilization protein [Sphingopyxis sp. LC81]|uniref:Putative plasmid stabilization protein n=1 Tax=Sphingopyxis fribergensis TaxID=1515612 RepID=A0A0A7PNN5_9SPHN|nr:MULTISPECIES: ParB/RepB/Spo0J family partition protein [Sphingopyxis]AJA11671.1 putative plasmid stabilization protein [Sphingopyxis fribergensis]KGB56430.1 putative plasmid stabilization protein [Sphingopyxis sp. LC81]KGB58427.1 putative plasmid stabilization protein [Sphingopyxis sp. LC363]